ncbi:PaaI family thioesterase [Henriciella aquimarina]|uniref:PaaI family thioesterase n=1 Tax=Henriciella aquimarina TaxID=545261 RepID=UPI000A05056C|nr:PaaI family thioesterase [Henriciella aquimarina]
MTSKVSVEDANAFLAEAFNGAQNRSEVILMEDGHAMMRLTAGPEHLRPGGYISGPTQMTMADSVTYMAIFTRLGITPMTVTSNLNMNFLRPCIGEAVIAEARLMKLGRTLALAEVEIRAEGSDKVASHAIVTYSIPPEA